MDRKDGTPVFDAIFDMLWLALGTVVLLVVTLMGCIFGPIITLARGWRRRKQQSTASQGGAAESRGLVKTPTCWRIPGVYYKENADGKRPFLPGEKRNTDAADRRW